MSKAFHKFINQQESGAKKKERIRQEKKQARKETQEFFAKKKAERWKNRDADNSQSASGQWKKPEHKPAVSGKNSGGSENQKKTRKKSLETPRPASAQRAAVTPQRPANTGKKIIKQNSAQKAPEARPDTGTMPLNKFIAHAGICSRRDAAEIVRSGKVFVNGTLITEPGFKVSSKDEIKVNGKQIAVRKNLVYILLNKPKDYITTTDDPQGRKTVLDIIRNATPERVYPIGRLDRNTTGVLLLTNDGELAQKLSHPSYEVKKIYEVTLDRPLLKKDFDHILKGITLEDGFIAPDVLAYADPKDKRIIGIEIHSGRNRIVRRIFEAVGYDVRNLDRVMYANLTKKNVERGKWRLLTEKEIRLLKYLNASYTKNKPAPRG